MKKFKKTFIILASAYFACVVLLFILFISQPNTSLIEAIKELSPVALASGTITLYITYIYQKSTIALQEQTRIISDSPNVIIRNNLELIDENNKILMKLRITDKNNILLSKARLNEVYVSWSDSMFGNYINKKLIYNNVDGRFNKLEYTPSDSDKFHSKNSDKEDFYYLNSLLDCTKSELFKNYFKMEMDVSVCSTNVEVRYLYSIIINPSETSKCDLKLDYIKNIEHKYYIIKEINYIGNSEFF